MEFPSHSEGLQRKIDRPDSFLPFLDDNSLAEVLRERILRPTLTSQGGPMVSEGVRTDLVFDIQGGKRYYIHANDSSTIVGQVDRETLKIVAADLVSSEFGVDLSKGGKIQGDEVDQDHIRTRTIVYPTSVEGLTIKHVHLFDEGEPHPFSVQVYAVATNPITQPESYVKPIESPKDNLTNHTV